MATFSGDIDLLGGTIGSRLIAIKDENGKDVQGVFIPIGYNQMKVFQDRNGKPHASFSFNMWYASKGIVEFWKKKRLTANEEINAYTVPSHRMELSLSQEYRQKLMERAKAILLEQHKDDWNTPDLQDEKKNRDLRNLIYSYLPSDLCTSVWMHKDKTLDSVPSAPQTVPQAASVQTSTWHPDFSADGNMSGGSAVPDNSDLPF